MPTMSEYRSRMRLWFAPIARLFGSGSKSAIARSVSTVVVDALDCQAQRVTVCLRPVTECRIGGAPFLAYQYAARAIILEVLVARVMATADHRTPHPVEPCIGFSVCPPRCRQSFSVQTPARLSIFGQEAVERDSAFRAAIADSQAGPVLRGADFVKKCKPSEALAGRWRWDRLRTHRTLLSCGAALPAVRSSAGALARSVYQSV
jgi:hypothetical protein